MVELADSAGSSATSVRLLLSATMLALLVCVKMNEDVKWARTSRVPGRGTGSDPCVLYTFGGLNTCTHPSRHVRG